MGRFIILLFIGFTFSSMAFAQTLCERSDTTFRVLHFTKTSGFDHGTREESKSMFETIGSSKGFTITDTQDASVFNNLDSLNTYSVIIFSNTSGNNLFNTTQKSNFESYMNGGGSYIGIHAATDTYRTGWSFYNEIVGGIVQTSPNHTSQNHVNTMDHLIDHEILQSLPSPWEKQEEYYYWDLNGGMMDSINFTPLLRVRRTGSDSYDRPRPMAWNRIFPGGARSFYTALGHKTSNYTNPGNDFSTLLSNAVCWSAYDKDAIILPSDNIKITGANLLIESANKGIILKAENGNCYQVTVGNSGSLYTILIECPNE